MKVKLLVIRKEIEEELEQLEDKFNYNDYTRAERLKGKLELIKQLLLEDK